MSTATLPFEVRQAIVKLGESLRTARARRNMSQDELATAAQVSRKTLYALENGAPGATIGTVVSVLWALGLIDTMNGLANPDTDEHGRILEAARRPMRVRSPGGPDNDF